MKHDKLHDAIGEIRDDFVSDADAAPVKRGKAWLRWGALAACVVLIVGTVYGLNRPQIKTDEPIPVAETEDATEEPEPTVEQPTGGVTIPAIELPEPGDNAEADMIGLVVYSGGIYTQAADFFGEDAVKIDGLLGEYLGHAEGRIDEWSSQDEYSQELSDTVGGDIYALEGYDTGFRIGLRNEYKDENGETVLWIQFLERLNGITLYTGADLLEERLRIGGRVESIQWQAHEDWDWNRGNIQDAELDEAVWDAFLNAADEAEFFSAWMPEGSFYPEVEGSSIYDNPNQTHLILNLTDGTTTMLRLIEGGYVGYHGMGWWYFVRLPEDVFDPVYDACGGTHIEWEAGGK